MQTALSFEIDGWLRQAQALQLAGRPEEAETHYRRVLGQRPHDADALLMFGAMLGCRGDDTAAVPLLERAVALRPDLPDGHAALGDSLAALGRSREAWDHYRRSLALHYDQPAVHFNLGNVLQALGQGEAAECSYRRSTDLAPTYAAAHYNLALLLRARGENAGAAQGFQQAALACPELTAAHQRLAETLHVLGRFAEAAVCWRQALEQRPGEALLHLSLGAALHADGHAAEAAACYRETLRLDPDCAEAHNNLAALLTAANDLATSQTHLHHALRLRPDYTDAHNNLGNLRLQQGAHPEAVAAYRQSIALAADAADAHLNLGNALLRLGDYRAGWTEYEWRTRSTLQALHGRRIPDGRRWQGEALPAGTLLVYAEQGLGDTLQFARFLPLARAQVGRLLFACPPELIRFLTPCDGFDALIPWDGKAKLDAPYDAQISLLSLPGLFDIDLERLPSLPILPCKQPLLPCKQEGTISGTLRPPPLKVGLVWAGNPRHPDDRRRSCPLRHFAPLAEIAGVELYGLQQGEAMDQALDIAFPLTMLPNPLQDFTDTAAALLELDLLISVDTAMAHLAGVMQRPAWILLPHLPDWRWGLDRTDTPWYPTLRLFRQPHPGDWQTVISCIAQQLKQIALRTE